MQTESVYPRRQNMLGRPSPLRSSYRAARSVSPRLLYAVRTNNNNNVSQAAGGNAFLSSSASIHPLTIRFPGGSSLSAPSAVGARRSNSFTSGMLMHHGNVVALPSSFSSTLSASSPASVARAATLYLQRQMQNAATHNALQSRPLVLHHHSDEPSSYLTHGMPKHASSSSSSEMMLTSPDGDEDNFDLRRLHILENNSKDALVNLSNPAMQSKSEGGIGGVWGSGNSGDGGENNKLPSTEEVIQQYHQCVARSAVRGTLRSSSNATSAASSRANSPFAYLSPRPTSSSPAASGTIKKRGGGVKTQRRAYGGGNSTAKKVVLQSKL